MAKELLVHLSGLPCSRCRAKVNGMEFGDRIGILPSLGPSLSLI
jgi:hypothetical protein